MLLMRSAPVKAMGMVLLKMETPHVPLLTTSLHSSTPALAHAAHPLEG